MIRALAILIITILKSIPVFAQSDHIRPPSLGIGFMLSDFITAQRIRQSSLSNVLNHNRWAALKEMGSGISLYYFKGIRNHIDFATTVSGSFFSNGSNSDVGGSSSFLLEADATANFKMFTDKRFFTPYLLAGAGVSLLGKSWGAYVPLGGGFKLNLFDEAAIFITSQYRVPVTITTNDYHFVYSLGISGVLGSK